MPRPIDPDSLGFLINDLARLMRTAFEREIEAASIPVTPAEARVLAHMSRKGPLQQARLACLLGVAPMSLSTFIDRLEAAGLVERTADPADRRAKLVDLTDAAGPVLERIAEAGRRARATATQGVDAPALEAFLQTARHLRDTLAAARAEAATTGRTHP